MRRRSSRRPAAAATAPFAVAYEDEHLLVVDKPAGVVVHPARGHRTGHPGPGAGGRGAGGEDPWRAGIVHRLDRDTSGLLVVAKSDEVHRALKALLAAAAAAPRVPGAGRPVIRRPAPGTIDAPIGRDRRDRVLMSIDTDEPREARTHFEIERLLPAPRCCGSSWRPAAPTRSGSTWRPSATRCAATRSTARPASTGWSASSCTPPGWPSRIR